MQWLINEFKDLKAEVFKKVDTAVTAWAEGQLRDAEEIEKLKGEIKAMKARMGKAQQK